MSSPRPRSSRDGLVGYSDLSMHCEEIVSHIDALLRELRDNRDRLEHARALLVAEDGEARSSLAGSGHEEALGGKAARRGAKSDGAARMPAGRSVDRAAAARGGAAVARPDARRSDAPDTAPAEGRRVLPVDRRVMVALIERTPGISTHEIAERLSYDPAAVRRILMRMQEQGEASSTITDGRQLWSIVSEEIRYAKRMAELEAALSGGHGDAGAEHQGSAGSLSVK